MIAALFIGLPGVYYNLYNLMNPGIAQQVIFMEQYDMEQYDKEAFLKRVDESHQTWRLGDNFVSNRAGGTLIKKDHVQQLRQGVK